MDEPDLDDLLVSARSRRANGDEPPHRDGSLQRIRRGYYRPAGAGLTALDDYLLRIRATAEARTGELVFSHVAAAALWGCPLLNVDTRLVHATQPGKARRTTARTQIHRTAVPDEHVVSLPNGLLVTSPAWTAVQVAAHLPLPNVLLPLDHLLHLLVRDPEGDPAGAAVVGDLVALVREGSRGWSRARSHLDVADARSGSAGESLSRGQMILLGIPRPQLQVSFPRPDGAGCDVVDFDWPELETFGEFDGRGKYFDPEMARESTPEEVLWEEKLREDRIRARRPHCARWDWATAMSRPRLAAVLRRAGVRPER